MTRFLQFLFFAAIVRPIVLLVLGLNIRHRNRLPQKGPAILVANHNSHLDTLVLMTLFSSRTRRILRPVAAADYFLRNRILAWFAINIIQILPIARKGAPQGEDVLAGCSEALKQNQILVLFPEGTRGEPERLDRFRSGIARLTERHSTIPVVPVFLHGLGKSLPKGEALLVPFFCDVFVGEPITWNGEHAAFMSLLNERMKQLSSERSAPAWE